MAVAPVLALPYLASAVGIFRARLACLLWIILLFLSSGVHNVSIFGVPINNGSILGLPFVSLQAISLIFYPLSDAKALSLQDKSAYLLYSPQFASGPIEKIESLVPQFTPSPFSLSASRWADSLLLLFAGMCRKSIILVPLFYLLQYICEANQPLMIPLLLPASYIFFYQDIQSYTEIAQGCSILLNINLSNNFNRPYLACSFTDLWARWHITVSSWFTTYCAKPVMKALVRRRIRRFAAPVGAFSSYLCFGFWHGPSIISFFAGLAFALAFVIEYYFLAHIPHPRYTVVRWIFVQLTISFVCCLLISSSLGFFEGIHNSLSATNASPIPIGYLIIYVFLPILLGCSIVGLEFQHSLLARINLLLDEKRVILKLTILIPLVSLVSFQATQANNLYQRLGF